MASSLVSLLRGGDVIMWRIKSCPRCGGDLFIDKDLNNWYEQCLQCSYWHELRDIAEIEELSARREKKPAPA